MISSAVISAAEALGGLRAGNARFVAGVPTHTTLSNEARRSELVLGQAPSAIVLGCSDSRVPVEVIFDHGVGELFVVRVAGNIATRSQIGSVEYAAATFGTRLVVVLGHSSCGAVSATLKTLQQPQQQSVNLNAITDHIGPAIAPLLTTSREQPDKLLAQAVRANVRASVQQLRGSRLLESLILNDGLHIVGAEYALDTGEVDFFEDAPLPPAKLSAAER